MNKIWALWTLLIAPVLTQEPALVFAPVVVVDVELGRTIPDQAVVVADGKIVSVGPASAAPAGQRVPLPEGTYLMPGLVDAHVHWIDPAGAGPLMLAHGVTLVRDMGNTTQVSIRSRDALRTGDRLGPEMLVAGAIVDGNPPVWPSSEVCDTPEQGRAAVERLAAAGVDFIKVYSRLKPEVWKAVAAAATDHGLPFCGHIPGEMTVEDAVAGGQRTLEHLDRFGDLVARAAGEEGLVGWREWEGWQHLEKADGRRLSAVFDSIRQRNAYVCPTLVVMEGIGRIGDPAATEDSRLAYMPSFAKSLWDSPRYRAFAPQARQVLPHLKQMVGHLHQAGVRLLCGSDLANPNVFPGFSLHDEMTLFQEAGVPAPDVLRAAITWPLLAMTTEKNPLTDRLGAIRPGFQASFVLLTANPLEDATRCRLIHGVVHHGKHYDRSALDSMMADVKRMASGDPTAGAAAEAPDASSLPGEVIHRGRFRIRFGIFDGGEESCVITEDGDGKRHLHAVSRPSGGGMEPSTILAETAKGAGPVVRVRWYRPGKPTMEMVRTAGGFEVRSGSEDATIIVAEPGAVLTGNFWSLDALSSPLHGLEVGATASRQTWSFGVPGVLLGEGKAHYERLPDEVLGEGAEAVSCRRLKIRHESPPAGSMEQALWIDAQGMVRKTQLKLPTGSLRAVFEPSSTPR